MTIKFEGMQEIVKLIDSIEADGGIVALRERLAGMEKFRATITRAKAQLSDHMKHMLDGQVEHQVHRAVYEAKVRSRIAELENEASTIGARSGDLH